MRKKFDDLFSMWPMFALILVFMTPIIMMFTEIAETTTEIYTATCEVTNKYEDEETKLNVSVSSLLKMPIMKSDTIYIVVVEYEGNSYDIEVDEDQYKEIKIGEQVKCEVEFKHNERHHEEHYEFSILKEN